MTHCQKTIITCQMQRKERGCCISLAPLLAQMVKAGECDGATTGVSHTSNKDGTHSDKQATEMDVTLLKEQYHCIRKKLRTHVVWFKTANNEEMSGKPLVSVVPLNQNMRKAKAFEVEMPFKEIRFNFPGILQDYESPWHTHLEIYHNTQTEHRNTGTAEESAKTMYSGEQPSPTADPSLTKDISLSCQQMLEEQVVDTSEVASKSDVPEHTSNCCLGDSLTHSPRKLSTPVIQTGRQSLVAYKPPNNTKLLCYPFPQKKCPKKSEAARRLGLYVTH